MAGAESSPDGEAAAVGGTPEPSEASTGKRRRTGGPSSRGVANLTPEQLARKRANDREAQRAIRERTKNQIDSLNRRIRELETQQPYHDLQVVVREKEAIQAENAEIRSRLQSVLTILQPILRPSGLSELAAAAERSPLPIAPSSRESTSRPYDPRAVHLHHDIASPQIGVHSPAATDSSRQWLSPSDAPTNHVRQWSGDSSHFEQSRPAPPPIQTEMPFDERLGVDFLLDNGQRRVDPSLPVPPQPQAGPSSAAVGQYAPSLVPHLILPRTIPATCPLDEIMLSFLAERSARAAEGVPPRVLAGPPYPNFTALVYPDRAVDAHPASKLFTDIIRTFSDICGLPEQVAVVFTMFLVMRWQIDPTQENYERLPDWMTPRPSQLFVPHPYWVNHLPWPRLRDRLISIKPFTLFDTFFVPFTTTVSLNWPYDPRDCLIRAPRAVSNASSIRASSPYSTPSHTPSPAARLTPQPVASALGPIGGFVKPKDDDQWVINPDFEAHIRDLKNWSLGPAFATAFPQLADAVRIKEAR